MSVFTAFAAAAKAPPKSQRWPSFFKSLFIPIVVVVLFYFAPLWLNNRLRERLITAVNASLKLTEEEKTERIGQLQKVDLSTAALEVNPETLQLHQILVRSGLATTYQYLHLGFLASVGLLILQIAAMGATVALNSRAQASQASLIKNYRLAWQLSMGAAFIQIVILVPLLIYASYELPVIWSDQWYPKLVICTLIAGATVIWRAGKILLATVPLQFQEPLSRRIKPEQAPEMWAAVRSAAERLNTAPPDNIVVGVQLNFYVTELSVWAGTELVTGRTLFLSYPLLKQLPEDEVLAIIGHELGHFIGADTVMTREFYPLRLKTQGTLVALHHATFVGWASFHFLNFFHWSFGETQRRVSRERELKADAKAAELTSPSTAARALVRLHVLIEAFKLGVINAVTKEGQSPLDVQLHTVVREKLPTGVAFWNELFEKKLSHPLDTHPALHVRLESLGQTMDAKAAEALASQEAPSAYDRWFAVRPEALADLRGEADEALRKVQARSQVTTATQETEAGRQLLQTHFPARSWNARKSALWFPMIFFGFLFLGLTALMLFLPLEGTPTATALGVRSVFAILACLPAFGISVIWKHYRNSVFTLDSTGLNHTGWNRPVQFTGIDKITFKRSYGTISMRIHLKQREAPYWKGSLFKYRRRTLNFSLSTVEGIRQQQLAQLVFDYLTRQIRS